MQVLLQFPSFPPYSPPLFSPSFHSWPLDFTEMCCGSSLGAITIFFVDVCVICGGYSFLEEWQSLLCSAHGFLSSLFSHLENKGIFSRPVLLYKL
uniref:Uncharacterized protein n=1 Tax=Picea sitchensis TaxID=3332 RepID=B8LPD2_PICSI|nr:unknown [Picea sitchensis]